MGRRFCPNRVAARPTGLGGAPKAAAEAAGARAFFRAALRLAALGIGVAGLALAAPAAAAESGASTPKTASAKAAAKAAPAPAVDPNKMVVEADELRQDEVKNTVSAVGSARVYYKGRLLEADRVTLDRNSGRVVAEGHAKRTEADGTILYGDYFDLTDDFRDGFIHSLRIDTTDKTYFSAPFAERINEDTTVFTKGTYTACAACGSNYDRPPLWRVRAKRIIHKNDEQMLYYENATVELFGMPVVYMPYFSSPDPTVTRKSGVLMPSLVTKSALGYGFGVPIFWALAPDYDITFTPTFLSKQGFLASGEWRQRLEHGEYFIRANGIDQLEKSAFPASPWGAADIRMRGSLESKGEVQIADHWKFGWQFTVLSDKWFLNDYNIPSQTLSSNYINETTTTAYLIGQDRGYFDLRGYRFEGLSSHDIQPQQTAAYPVFDYNKTFDVDPAISHGIGGQIETNFNLASLSAATASFQSVGTRVLDNAYSLYPTCTNYVPGRVAGTCLLRGIAGIYTRASLDVSWKRQYIDPIGEVWTPFAFTRVNGEILDLTTSGSFGFASSAGSSAIYNSSQLPFLQNTQDAAFGALNPGVGFEYRYPFFAKTSFGSVSVTPIGQIIARPNNQIGSYGQANLDAQSLVFDEASLFQWDKYSGYDRFETGTRANYGGQATLNFQEGGYINVIGGQSYQLAGTNAYATPDAANVGLSSGLDTRLSDYVGAVTVAPSSAFALTTKGRFDVNGFAPRRIDVVGTYNLGAWTGGIQYANYQAQPEIGYYVRRQGLALNSRYKVSDNYWAQGNITFDMSRQFYPASMIGYSNPGPFAIAAFGVGAGYQDDCTTLSVNFSSVYQDNGNGGLTRNQTVLVQLELRTLGQIKLSQTFSNTSNLDGLNY
ncbi:LPS-assembly protein LptD [Methylocella silvestris]|uniref:LPS-assembly protein LptD n=1 Tax=Methylocella silvestris TaxID=199596 RepID=A0A2J7TCI4_METSI|nr:LPS-assembly protein LptD [Methylocella silvestris]PNG24473.1 organic solvent tolerance protein [Methylocella silvestris]